jgi:ribosomal protein S18 acetylase RimI-like enzyme
VLLREGRAEDAAPLRAFRCSSGAWYAEEVEQYIRGPLADAVEGEKYPGKVLMLVDGEDSVVAVSAHYAQLYEGPRVRPAVTGSHIQVFAVATEWQGQRIEGASVASTMLNATVRMCLREGDRDPVVTGLVAAENEKMRRVLRSLGFQEDDFAEARPDSSGVIRPYIWVDWRQ